MLFFDTHTHLDYFSQISPIAVEKVIAQAKQHNVVNLMIVAIGKENFAEIIALSHRYSDSTVYGLGLHPLYIKKHTYADLDYLEAKLTQNDPQCVAIGEIGLDRSIYELTNEEIWHKQCDFLNIQLSFAKRYDLPVNLHSRKSHEQLYPFLKKIQLNKRGVVHGFAGSYVQAKRFVDLGYYIGVGGTITYPRANKTRETIAKLPLEALLLETDSPDMPINGYQGQPNRPQYLTQIFHALCQLRDESPALIAETIYHNSLKLFSQNQR